MSTATDLEQVAAGLPHPELLDDLARAAFLHADMTHARSQQVEVGISALGGCRRQAGYQHHRVPVDPEWELLPKPEAMLGLWIHRGMLPSLRRLLHPARIEMRVQWTPGTVGRPLPTLPGTLDLYRQRSQLVLDVKTVRMASTYARRGPWPRQLYQPLGYASALRQQGKPVEWVALLFVGREDGSSHLHLQRYDEADAAEAVEWWAQVAEAGDPQELPADRPGPGLARSCDECPWLRRCWGPAAVPGHATVQGLDPVDMDAVVSALRMRHTADKVYLEGGRMQRAAKPDRDFARALLEGVPPGTYGDMTLTWQRGRSYMDQQAVRQLLADLNIGVPMAQGEATPKITPAGA